MGTRERNGVPYPRVSQKPLTHLLKEVPEQLTFVGCRIAQPVKCLLHNPEGVSSGPQNPQ